MDVRGDFLVIGSGIAGLRAALTRAEAGDVVVLTKADATEGNTGVRAERRCGGARF